MGTIRVNHRLSIDERDMTWTSVRSSGPGGQNVNKVSTAVQLRFVTNGVRPVPPDIRSRLERLAGSRLTADGTLIVTAQRHRTQERNRQDAFERLLDLLRQASRRPRSRKPTKPTAGSRERRLADKRRQSHRKQSRRSSPFGEDPG